MFYSVLATNSIDQPCREIQTLDLQEQRQHLRKHSRRARPETQDKKKIEDNSSSVEQKKEEKEKEKIMKRAKSALTSSTVQAL